MAPLPNPNRITASIMPQGEVVTWIATPEHHKAAERFFKEPLKRMARIGLMTWCDLHTVLTGVHCGLYYGEARDECRDMLALWPA